MGWSLGEFPKPPTQVQDCSALDRTSKMLGAAGDKDRRALGMTGEGPVVFRPLNLPFIGTVP